MKHTRLPKSVVYAVALLCLLPTLLAVLGSASGIATWYEDSVALGPAGKLLLSTLTLTSGVHAHTALEWATGCTAVILFGLACVYYSATRIAVVPILTLAIFFAGCTDILRGLIGVGAIEAIASDGQRLALLWSTHRGISALLLLVGALFSLSRRPLTSKRTGIGFAVVFALLFAVLAYRLTYLLGTSVTIPTMIDVTRWVPRPYDLVAFGLFVFAGLVVAAGPMRWRPTPFNHAIVIATVPLATAQLLMAFVAIEPFAVAFNTAHMLSGIAYATILIGLSIEFVETFDEQHTALGALKQAQDRLSDQAAKIVATNRELERTMGMRDAAEADRIEAERALSESERRLRAILNNAPAVISVKRLDGCYTLVNRQFERIFEMERGQVEGKTDDKLFASKMAQAYREHDRMVFASKAPMEFDETVLTDDGFRTYQSVKFPLQGADGSTYAVCSIATDVTERRKAEEEIRQSNEELERFAYVASHDLQEPLRMVSSYTQLLAKRYVGKLDEDADDFIGFAVDGAGRMHRLINDLLEYSRVGTRGRELEPTNAEETLEIVLSDLQVAIEECGAQVTHDPLPMVMADPTQLRQLLQNLVGNALKYRGDHAPKIHVGCRQGEDGHWQVTVRDNGIGIAPEHFDRIFQIFQRLHGRGEYSGTGIGLAVCKKIVERHGGRIWVESEAGEGSEFHFTIHPAVEAAVHAS